MRNLLLGFVLLLLSSCGTNVIRLAEAPEKLSGTIAVLPIEANTDIQREKVDYLQKAFNRELAGNGYSVLSDSTVSSICKNRLCPERDELVKKYGIKNFLRVELDSTSQSNVVAGYYNELSGKAYLEDITGKPLVTVEHTESEKGGLVFNTGLLIQALRSASKGFEDASQKLADSFVTKVVAKLPQSDRNEETVVGTKIKIAKVDVIPLGESKYRICAEGTPSANGKLLINSKKYSLRETSPGTYCNVVLSGLSQVSSTQSILLESVYGDTIQKEFSYPEDILCNPSTIIYKENSSTVSLGCEVSEDQEKCLDDVNRCKSTRFLVYRSYKEDGPFEKVGKVAKEGWKDTMYDGKGLYTVLAVSPEGSTSLPIKLK